jgi:hypothetical protein
VSLLRSWDKKNAEFTHLAIISILPPSPGRSFSEKSFEVLALDAFKMNIFFIKIKRFINNLRLSNTYGQS